MRGHFALELTFLKLSGTCGKLLPLTVRRRRSSASLWRKAEPPLNRGSAVVQIFATMMRCYAGGGRSRGGAYHTTLLFSFSSHNYIALLGEKVRVHVSSIF
jgi:hypothetical protein